MYLMLIHYPETRNTATVRSEVIETIPFTLMEILLRLIPTGDVYVKNKKEYHLCPV